MKASKIERAASAVESYEEMQQEMQTVSEQQVCGWFDVNRGTLIRAGIKRVEILPGVVRYRVKDVKEFIEKNSVKPVA